MRIWIVGKNGMLAQAFQRKLSKNGIDHIATSQWDVDITNLARVKDQFKSEHFTHVLNCSGYTAVDLAEKEIEKAYALNCDAVEILASLSQEYKKKIIHFSTDYVFNGSEDVVEENTLTSPLSIYGKSKSAGEEKLFYHCPQACLVRTSWLFGKEGNNFVKKMIELMQSREVIHVVSDQIGQPTYADDLVDAVLTILNESGTFHFANKGIISWFEWAKIIKKKLEEKNIPHLCKTVCEVSSKDYGAKAQRPGKVVLQTKTFSPSHWNHGLDKVIDYVIK